MKKFILLATIANVALVSCAKNYEYYIPHYPGLYSFQTFNYTEEVQFPRNDYRIQPQTYVSTFSRDSEHNYCWMISNEDTVLKTMRYENVRDLQADISKLKLLNVGASLMFSFKWKGEEGLRTVQCMEYLIRIQYSETSDEYFEFPREFAVHGYNYVSKYIELN